MTIQIYKAINSSSLLKTESIEEGCWVRIYTPTESEIDFLHTSQNIPRDFLTDPLDSNEGSRIEKDEGYLLIILRSPIQDDIEDGFFFETVPIGIILKNTTVYTICIKPIPLLASYIKHGNQEISMFNKKTVVLKLLENSALLILEYVKNIEKKHQFIEKKMISTKSNQDLIDLHNLKKSLVYFTSAIRGNIAVLNKLKRNQMIQLNEEEMESIDDIWVELTQALAICETHANNISSTLNTFSSLVSNEISNVMKILACVTLFLIIPTLLTSIYGMNISNIPFIHNAHVILLFSLFTIGVIILFFYLANKKKWI
jgi:magnesium transporter